MRPIAATDTQTQYRAVLEHCWSIFSVKLADYGPAWRMFRLISVVDQIYIKARRIRRLEELGGRGRVEDSAADEYAGILNYAVISLWHLDSGDYDLPEALRDVRFEAEWTDLDVARRRYFAVGERARELLARKNHDYGEAWREMAIESITDELLSRTVRLKGLLEADPVDRDRVASQLYDVINYAAFALIRLDA